ncbi:hypothetical protein DSL92_04170 [Billgrantia gudaonensis]|uniref:Uncharacterized protein n=1 Tax=Billgrantia gudaonensis TaxID=376427 RepID=A0A3S0QRV7_9GAMM|nr:hypothetical protein DSL92_04170 [Halomonas gudaonensis]
MTASLYPIFARTWQLLDGTQASAPRLRWKPSHELLQRSMGRKASLVPRHRRNASVAASPDTTCGISFHDASLRQRSPTSVSRRSSNTLYASP